ncbi:hypothetical protein TNCV_2206951 [Trichonephila clavipes]|uniref:Uncharacterized protein n=1 Tax=Trichonephila clavipes TaxID=2585209 RepID=A0A8X6S1R2_TRICX|nr:hypothetical protein TNCV_2206951 [Trichonephila clavipes]
MVSSPTMTPICHDGGCSCAPNKWAPSFQEDHFPDRFSFTYRRDRRGEKGLTANSNVRSDHSRVKNSFLHRYYFDFSGRSERSNICQEQVRVGFRTSRCPNDSREPEVEGRDRASCRWGMCRPFRGGNVLVIRLNELIDLLKLRG